MSIVKIGKRTRGFFMMANSAIEDSRLTWAARGLLAFLLSKPESWEVNLVHLKKQGPLGRDGLYTLLNELIRFGYVVRDRERDKRGRLQKGVNYVVYEQPQAPDPEIPEQAMLNPASPDQVMPEQATCPNPGTPEQAQPEQAEPVTASPQHSNTELVVSTDKDKKTTTTTTGCSGCLIFPKKLEMEELDLIRDEISVCPGVLQQDVLDELDGALSGGDVRSPVGFLATLVAAARAGTFTLRRGAKVKAARRRQAQQVEREKQYVVTAFPQARATQNVSEKLQGLKDALQGGPGNDNS